MFTCKVEFPTEWTHANLYPLSDWHIGDPHCSIAEVNAQIQAVQDDPNGICILNGDLANTATRNGVSDIYAEYLSPMQEIDVLTRILRPIADKVAFACCGNHEARIYKSDGIDIMKLVCRELGVEERYCADGGLVYIVFGSKDDSHHKEGQPLVYSLYSVHGSGGGRKEGSKAVRLADMASIIDADIYLHSHTHLPMVMKQKFYRCNAGNCSASAVEHLFLNTSSALSYGGYGQVYEFKPASNAMPYVRLDGRRKNMTAVL